MRIKTKSMVPINKIKNTNPKQKDNFYDLINQAILFMKKHHFYKEITKGWVAFGIEGILGVFFFRLVPAQDYIDKEMWVVVEDIPPAIIYTRNNPNVFRVLEDYNKEMGLWVDAVKNKKSVEDLIPVNVPPTSKWANSLETRLKFIKSEILTNYKHELENNIFSYD